MTPTFFVCGCQKSDGTVVLMASIEVTNATHDVQSVAHEQVQWAGDLVRHLPAAAAPRHQFTAEMRSIITVVGTSYVEAWQKLFDAMNHPAWGDDQSRTTIAAHYAFHPPQRPIPNQGWPFLTRVPNGCHPIGTISEGGSP